MPCGKALEPTAAGYFIIIVCRFFARRGEKTTHEELSSEFLTKTENIKAT